MRHRVILITLISFSLFFTSCLTMSYHSPRVTEPNTVQLGGGVAVNNSFFSAYVPTGELFCKYGIAGGYDFGIHLNSYSIIDGIGFSVKNQFDLNQSFIDGINFEYGLMGFSFIPFPYEQNESYMGINLLRNNFALQLKLKKIYNAEIGTPVSNPKEYIINSFNVNLSYEIRFGKTQLLAYIGGQRFNRYEFRSSYDYTYTTDILYSKYYEIDEQRSEIGLYGGISYYFNIR